MDASTLWYTLIILTIGASVFGYAIAWILRSGKLKGYRKDFHQQKRLVSQLKEEQESLIRHSNNLQSETLKISSKNEKQAKRISSMKDMVRQLENDKSFVIKEYDQFRSEVRTKLEKRSKLLEVLDDLKDKNQKVKLKADKWKIKVHELQEQLILGEAAFVKLKKERDQIAQRIGNSEEPSFESLEWEKNYKELKLQFLALTKEKKEIESELNDIGEQKGASMDDTLNKLSEEIVLLKKENKVLKSNASNAIRKIKVNPERTDVLDLINERKKQVDFRRIGKVSPKDADDLKILKGLGNLMEQKFNAIGIYTFDQLASFNEYDEKLFDFFLELPQGKIKSEKWVNQAKALVSKDEIDEDSLKRVKLNLEKLDLDSGGEASPSQKDNLQSIIGIGPFIEQQLNAIGIFRFEQMAQLNQKDIDEINSIMKLAPGHIQKDDWVGQATRMK